MTFTTITPDRPKRLGRPEEGGEGLGREGTDFAAEPDRDERHLDPRQEAQPRPSLLSAWRNLWLP